MSTRYDFSSNPVNPDVLEIRRESLIGEIPFVSGGIVKPLDMIWNGNRIQYDVY